MIHVPCISYSMPSISITKKQAGSLHIHLIPRLLPKLGISSEFSRATVFGSRQLGGLGIKNINAINLVHKLQVILKHTRTNSDIEIALLIMLQWMQLLVGSENNNYHNKHRYIIHGYHVTSTTKEPSVQNKVKNTLARSVDPKKSWVGDITIMDTFVSIWHFSTNNTRILNNYILYRHIILLSEILRTNGTYI